MHLAPHLPTNTDAWHNATPSDNVSRRALCLRTLRAAAGAWVGLSAPLQGWAQASVAESEFWQALKAGGCVALLRHAQTEAGTGDPAGFDLNVCATQRNLSDEGRAQARAWGTQFVQRRIPIADVRTSAWCRAKDTARLAFGRYRIWSPLNSFFDGANPARRAQGQTNDVIRFIDSLRTPRNTLLVTHQVNITALTGETPAMGEMLLIRPHTRNALAQAPAVGGKPGHYTVLARLHLPG